MVRIYFDWNVFSNMRKKTNNLFGKIENFAKSNENHILLIYSTAHLEDLYGSYSNSTESRRETENDLIYLGEITRNHAVGHSSISNETRMGVECPTKYFKDNYVNNFPIRFLENILDKYNNLLKLPTRIDFTSNSNLPDNYKGLLTLFPKTKEEDCLKSFIRDLLDISINSDKFDKVFRELRGNFNSDLKIKTDEKSWKDPFNHINKILKKCNIDKGITQYLNEYIVKTKPSATLFDIFIQFYITLDLYGYKKDKNTSNLITDSMHSYYGAHTDIFVTDDSNTNEKSKILYKEFNILTDVLYSNEFINHIEKKIFSKEKTINDQLQLTLSNLILIPEIFDDEGKQVEIYKVSPFFLNYFDRLQIGRLEKHEILMFTKKKGNYSSSIFWTEIKEVLNKITTQFGDDESNNGLLEENEKDEINNLRWDGRFWETNSFNIVVKYENPYRLRLSVIGKFFN